MHFRGSFGCSLPSNSLCTPELDHDVPPSRREVKDVADSRDAVFGAQASGFSWMDVNYHNGGAAMSRVYYNGMALPHRRVVRVHSKGEEAHVVYVAVSGYYYYCCCTVVLRIELCASKDLQLEVAVTRDVTRSVCCMPYSLLLK